MSEYGVGVGVETGSEAEAGVRVDAAKPEPEPAVVEEPEEPEPVEDYPEADPQEWISGLIRTLERAEQGIGSGPRDALMARIKLAQAYSELGDMVQAAPLAVANVAQAARLFPSSEGMLRQLREFRDAVCEAAGWTAAMMREPEEETAAEQEPSELVARAEQEAEAAEAGVRVDAAKPEPEPAVVEEPEEPEPVQVPETEPSGAVIHEFVRRTAEADPQSVVTPPAELAIPSPPEPEYAEEVAAAVPATGLAAYEEIIRLRYELREAQRTVERLKHVNRKLREALEFEAE